MAHIRRFFIAIIVSLLYATIVYSATLRSEDFVETLQKRIALNSNAENIRIARAIDTDKTNESDNLSLRNCDKQPCGWAVYVPFIRRIDEYISNKCSCADKSYKCVRTDDDLSVSAYVYHCRQNTTSKDIAAPEQSYS